MNKSRTIYLRKKYIEIFGRAPTTIEFRHIKRGYNEDPHGYIKDLEKYKVTKK